ncbi:MAG: histidinol-phosphate transaminase [Gammaproteobacteria bacterium]|nr:histidinol-phosphate transaminase [Gammaproteobacteria bacterium]
MYVTDYLELAAPGVKGLRPYQPGKPVEELEREYGISNIIKLASNENPLGPSPLALDAIRQELDQLARYPDGNGFVLKQALSTKLGVPQSHITLGNGSNDILEIIVRAFATPDNDIIFSRHAFAVYPLVVKAINAKPVETPAKDWGHDLDAMTEAVTENTRLIFIANPNNPTGTWLAGAALKAFIAGLPRHVIVVVDEAYFEYAIDPRMQAEGYPDALQWLDEFPNLIVTRTFSKAYGLAALRVGYAVSHPGIADLLNRVRQPFNVNHLALVAASAALNDAQHLDKGIHLNAVGMQQLVEGFDAMGLTFIPSVGNFISVDVGKEAAGVYDALLREGVIVRPVANYQMPNHLRVTIGLAQENARFLQSLQKVLA